MIIEMVGFVIAYLCLVRSTDDLEKESKSFWQGVSITVFIITVIYTFIKVLS